MIHRAPGRCPRSSPRSSELGDVADDEMARVFNLGIGMVAVVSPADVARALDILAAAGIAPVDIGEIVAGHGAVHLSLTVECAPGLTGMA